jgi:hypothetical protein
MFCFNHYDTSTTQLSEGAKNNRNHEYRCNHKRLHLLQTGWHVPCVNAGADKLTLSNLNYDNN